MTYPMRIDTITHFFILPISPTLPYNYNKSCQAEPDSFYLW